MSLAPAQRRELQLAWDRYDGAGLGDLVESSNALRDVCKRLGWDGLGEQLKRPEERGFKAFARRLLAS